MKNVITIMMLALLFLSPIAIAQTIVGPLGPTVYVDSSGNLQVKGHVQFPTDNTFDFGGSGTNRPRRIYAGTDFVGPVGATTPNPGTFTTVDSKVVNGIAYSHKYTGATLDVRVNACIVDAAAGTNGATSHICSSEGEAVAQTISAQINVGNVAQDKVTWRLPASCLWDAIMTGGTSVAIKQFSRSYIQGQAPLLSCEFRNMSTSNGILAMYTNAGGGYYRAKGFVLESKNTAVASNAVMLIPGGFDASTYEDIEILSYIAGTDGILMGNTGGPCCSVTFNRITINNNSTGGIPLHVVGNVSGITNGIYFIDSSIDHPAAGQPNMSVSNSNATIPLVMGFSGTYEETHDSAIGGADTTTTPNQLSGLLSIFFNGIEVKSFSANNVAPIFSLSGTAIMSFSLRDLSTPLGFTEPATAVRNNITSTACPSTPCNITTDSKGQRTSYETNDTWGDNASYLGRVRSAWYDFIEQTTSPTGIAAHSLVYSKTADHKLYTKLNAGTELSLLTSDATIGIPGANNITPVTVNANTASDQTLQEISLSAGYLNVLNQPFLIDATGLNTIGAGQTPTLTYKLKLCTVSGCGSGTVRTLYSITTGATVAATGDPWRMTGTIITNAIGATGTMIPSGSLKADIGASASQTQNDYQDVNTGTISGTIDLTAALFLDFTVSTSAGSALNFLTQKTGVITPQSNVANAGVIASAPFFNGTPGTGTAVTPTSNKALLIGFYLPYQVTFSKLTYRNLGVDNTANLYDIGIYNSAGTLLCDIGPTAGTSFSPTGNSNLTFNCVQGAMTIPAGQYYYGFTGNAATATIGGTSLSWTNRVNTGSLVTSGGQLATPVVPGADVWATTTIPAIILN